MMRNDLDILQQVVEGAVKRSPIASSVSRVELDPGAASSDENTLRVVVSVRTLDEANEDDLIELMDLVQESVNEIDERAASVRFAEAA